MSKHEAEAEPLFLARLPEGQAEFVVMQAPHHPTLLFFGIVDPAGLVENGSSSGSVPYPAQMKEGLEDPHSACVRAGFCLPPDAVVALALQLMKWASNAQGEGEK